MMSNDVEVRIKMSPLKAGRLYMKSAAQQNEIAELKVLLKEVLLNTGWTERDDGLWDMPDRGDFFSSSDGPLTINDAIHINNAIVSLLLPETESKSAEAAGL